MEHCQSGKKCYPNAQNAWRIIAIQESRQWRKTHKKRATPDGRAYHCESCGQWHITHPKDRRARPKERRPARQDLYREVRS